ncbi:hypothetical protein TRVL_07573 [Trypanosoma vivax]|nr:hypothetical protein TRVL_07573 [Trypanosoma vivax]
METEARQHRARVQRCNTGKGETKQRQQLPVFRRNWPRRDRHETREVRHAAEVPHAAARVDRQPENFWPHPRPGKQQCTLSGRTEQAVSIRQTPQKSTIPVEMSTTGVEKLTLCGRRCANGCNRVSGTEAGDTWYMANLGKHIAGQQR